MSTAVVDYLVNEVKALSLLSAISAHGDTPLQVCAIASSLNSALLIIEAALKTKEVEMLLSFLNN